MFKYKFMTCYFDREMFTKLRIINVYLPIALHAQHTVAQQPVCKVCC